MSGELASSLVPDRVRAWLTAPATTTPLVRDPRAPTPHVIELLVVLTVTTGVSVLRSALSLLEAVLAPVCWPSSRSP